MLRGKYDNLKAMAIQNEMGTRYIVGEMQNDLFLKNTPSTSDFSEERKEINDRLSEIITPRDNFGKDQKGKIIKHIRGGQGFKYIFYKHYLYFRR